MTETIKINLDLPKVRNMQSHSGNDIANQYIIETNEFDVFQSYRSIIVVKELATGQIYLDATYWDYSTTTGKYRNLFLNETKKETEARIKDGTYKLAELN